MLVAILAILATAIIVIVPVAVAFVPVAVAFVPVAVALVFAGPAVLLVFTRPAVVLAVRSHDATGGQNQEPGDHAALDDSIQCIHGMPRCCVFRQPTLIDLSPGRGSL
jgi:hypothetical protein